MKRSICWIVAILLVVGITGLGIGCKEPEVVVETVTETVTETVVETVEVEKEAEETAGTGETYKIGFACKLLSNPWFVYEFNGMKAYAEEVGNVEMVGLDSNLDEELLLSHVDELIAQDCDAVIVCITSATIGPAIAEKTNAAGIPLLAIDDAFKDKDGVYVPYVGLPNYEIGVQGGQALARITNDRGYYEEGNVVKFVGTCSPKSPVQMERVNGFKAAMLQDTTLTEEENYLFAATDTGMMNEALVSVSAAVSAHPEVTHWIAFGLNDDSGIGALNAFNELGAENYISCGVGGYLLDEFAAGNENYITVAGYSYTEGYKAIEELYAFLTEGTPIPALTFVPGKVLDLNNWHESAYYEDWAAAQ